MSIESRKSRGRPKGSVSNNSATEKLPMVRITPEALVRYRSAAKTASMSFSAWVRDALDRAEKRK